MKLSGLFVETTCLTVFFSVPALQLKFA